MDSAYVWPRPVQVSERLPEEGQACLVYWPSYRQWQISWLAADPATNWLGWMYDGAGGYECYTTPGDAQPTHWLPLPPPVDGV